MSDDGCTPQQADRPVVDVHAHALIPAVDALVREQPGFAAQEELEARRNGAQSLAVSRRMVGEVLPRLIDLDVRLAEMDRQGVDVQVVSPSPSHYHYWTGPELATLVYRTANQAVADLVAARPDRLAGLGLVPLQHPQLCVEALDDAVRVQGLAGVEISSHAPAPGAAAGRATPDEGGVELSDPRLDPFWDRASQLGAVIFLHPFGCTLDERLDRFYLANTRPSSYLRRLWFDSLGHTPEALRRLVEAVGADRVLLGSDYPFDMGVTDPLQRLAAALPADQSAAVAGGNAAALGLVPRDGTAAPSPALTPSRRP